MTQGFIHIVESPAPDDLLDGRTEGRALSEALALARIPYSYNLATTHATLVTALGQRLGEAYRRFSTLPIIHLSMHGNENGVQLTGSDFVPWHELRGLLLPALRAMQGGLLVCLSSCKGVHGCRMAMYADKEPPFWALVGNKADTTWSDAAIAYITFYHLFFKGVRVHDCVTAMKTASGDDQFAVLFGQHQKDFWLEFLKQPHQGLLALLGGLSPAAAPVAGSAQPPPSST